MFQRTLVDIDRAPIPVDIAVPHAPTARAIVATADNGVCARRVTAAFLTAGFITAVTRPLTNAAEADGEALELSTAVRRLAHVVDVVSADPRHLHLPTVVFDIGVGGAALVVAARRPLVQAAAAWGAPEFQPDEIAGWCAPAAIIVEDGDESAARRACACVGMLGASNRLVMVAARGDNDTYAVANATAGWFRQNVAGGGSAAGAIALTASCST
jgi:hypothetical protein